MPAPWKSVLEEAFAKNADTSTANFMQLATVRLDGRPSCRWIVFRGFLGGDRLIFYGDGRTRKVAEIAKNPGAEMSTFFTGTCEQFRLQGTLHVVTQDEADEKLQRARLEAWRNMQNEDPGRQHPGWPIPRQDRVTDDSVFDMRETSADEVSENFCLFYLNVDEVDHYALAANRRRIYTKQAAENGSQAWGVRDVNP